VEHELDWVGPGYGLVLGNLWMSTETSEWYTETCELCTETCEWCTEISDWCTETYEWCAEIEDSIYCGVFID